MFGGGEKDCQCLGTSPCSVLNNHTSGRVREKIQRPTINKASHLIYCTISLMLINFIFMHFGLELAHLMLFRVLHSGVGIVRLDGVQGLFLVLGSVSTLVLR